jgi:hypothetical protein
MAFAHIDDRISKIQDRKNSRLGPLSNQFRSHPVFAFIKLHVSFFDDEATGLV